MRPYFFHQSSVKNDKNIASLTDEFKIFDLRTIERVNYLSYTTVKATIPSELLKDVSKSSQIKTTEDYFSSEMLKLVSICVDRPSPDYVPLELFQLKTWFHGIVTKNTFEVTPYCDVVTLELRPHFWLLTQQNNHRSFQNQDVKKILETIFLPYESEFQDKFQVHHEYAETPKFNQIIQNGESDFEFVTRIFERAGLSYFFYHDEVTCHLVITDKLSTAYDNIHKKFSTGSSADGKTPLTNPLKYLVMTGQERTALQVEGLAMPLFDFKVLYESPIQQLKVQSLPDYRSNVTTIADISQEESLATKADGFKLKQHYFIPMSSFASTKTQEKMDYLTSLGTRSLARDFSSKVTYFGHTAAYGFIPIWRKLSVDVNLNGKRKHQNIPTDYVSHLSDDHNFLSSALMHYFACPLESYFGLQSAKPRDPFESMYVEMNFFKMGDDNFKPHLEILHTPSLFRNEKTLSSQFVSAVVVKFEDNDKTENDFDVPNAMRVRFPWHAEGESVKARVSFFWTGNEYGSLFLPEEGSEVIVTFLAGDPDYPVIVGSCYNSTNNYPLNVKKRETEGLFGARGIVFKEDAARFIFETVKEKNDQKTQILTLSTPDGNLAVSASNIDAKAKKSSVLSITDSKSTLTMDDEKVKIDGFDGGGVLNIHKGQLNVSSGKIALNADGEVNVAGSVITANSLKLPG